jgi:tetratricopeptide (TPR) repeat protein
LQFENTGINPSSVGATFLNHVPSHSKTFFDLTINLIFTEATIRQNVCLVNMNSIREIEDLFLEADKAFDEGNHTEGKKLLEQILHEEPVFGRAHNHLGWLYKNRYQDNRLAEKHFLLAIKFEPEYTPTYINYAYLLRDEHRLDELEILLNTALKVKGINRCTVYDEFGSLYELRGDYKQAIVFYKKAISLCLNDKLISDLSNHIKRCKKKKGLLYRFRIFKGKF